MATKLKHLKVKKVDFVDEGANPDAHIRLFKRKDKQEDTHTEEPVTKRNGALRSLFSAISKILDLGDDETVTKEDLELAEKEAAKETGEAAQAEETETPENNAKGEPEEMKIDKSKMTPEELETLEDLMKRYGIEEEVAKSDDEAAEDTADVETTEEVDTTEEADEDVEKSIYKGLHPEVAAEIEELKKYKERAEEKELLEVAKKYEILGKKPEELVKKFKTLKDAGGTAYDDMISVLDESVTFAEKSGLFSEVGKSGHGDMSGSAEATARTKAVELMKSKPELTMAQAIDEVLESDPELRERYEKED